MDIPCQFREYLVWFYHLTAVWLFPSTGCIGLFCPCFLFGKNAEFLGSGTLIGSCATHFILCGLVTTVCCLLTDGLLLGLPACFVASYACGYRRALRLKYNLQVRHVALIHRIIGNKKPPFFRLSFFSSNHMQLGFPS